jgi:hypothetical protein
MQSVQDQSEPAAQCDPASPRYPDLDTRGGAEMPVMPEGALFYYEIYDYENGFNGCVDWTLPLFNRDLERGMEGYDVYLLQKALVLEVGFDPANCIGIFGPLTAAAVVQLQQKHGIAPTAPRCGPATRAYLNRTYNQLI